MQRFDRKAYNHSQVPGSSNAALQERLSVEQQKKWKELVDGGFALPFVWSGDNKKISLSNLVNDIQAILFPSKTTSESADSRAPALESTAPTSEPFAPSLEPAVPTIDSDVPTSEPPAPPRAPRAHLRGSESSNSLLQEYWGYTLEIVAPNIAQRTEPTRKSERIETASKKRNITVDDDDGDDEDGNSKRLKKISGVEEAIKGTSGQSESITKATASPKNPKMQSTQLLTGADFKFGLFNRGVTFPASLLAMTRLKEDKFDRTWGTAKLVVNHKNEIVATIPFKLKQRSPTHRKRKPPKPRKEGNQKRHSKPLYNPDQKGKQGQTRKGAGPVLCRPNIDGLVALIEGLEPGSTFASWIKSLKYAFMQSCENADGEFVCMGLSQKADLQKADGWFEKNRSKINEYVEQARVVFYERKKKVIPQSLDADTLRATLPATDQTENW
ncbi:hypothetical protein HDU96_001211, partial [Phlyctochytrium bullatum]